MCIEGRNQWLIAPFNNAHFEKSALSFQLWLHNSSLFELKDLREFHNFRNNLSLYVLLLLSGRTFELIYYCAATNNFSLNSCSCH